MITSLHKIKAADMDLRDHFASDAMKGMMANPECDLNANETVKAAYQIADLMMKAREVNHD